MCNIFSGYATSTGDIFCDPAFTHSHSLIAKIHNLNDGDVSFYRQTLAKFEFRPPEDTKLWSDLNKWNLVVDEDETPEWFDREKVRAHMEELVSSMFVRDARGVLLGGCWIFDGLEASAKGVIGGTIAGVINGANLANALLERTSFDHANLSRANLSRANLDGANLSRANLSRANLDGANLSRANLYGANLDGANLSRANLYGANLDGANLYGDVKLPKGWKRTESGVVVRDE